MLVSKGEWPRAFPFVIAPWALVGISVAVLVFGPQRVALAQGVPLSLDWDAPPECPDSGYVRRQVDDLFAGGSPPIVHVDARVTVVRGVDPRYSVQLRTVRNGRVGTRRMGGGSCRSLADAVAFVIALAIDPSRAAEARDSLATDSTADVPTASTPREASSDSAQSAPPSPPEAATEPEAASRSAGSRVSPVWRWRGAVSAAAVADTGSMPGIAFGFHLGAAAMVGPAELDGYATTFPRQNRPAGSPCYGRGGTFRLVLGGLRACYSGLRGDVDLAGCAGFELGSLHADGFGVRHPQAADSLWVAGTLGVRASLRIAGSFRLAFDLAMGVPLRRDRFVLDGIGLVHQASPVVGRAFAGPELRF